MLSFNTITVASVWKTESSGVSIRLHSTLPKRSLQAGVKRKRKVCCRHIMKKPAFEGGLLKLIH